MELLDVLQNLCVKSISFATIFNCEFRFIIPNSQFIIHHS